MKSDQIKLYLGEFVHNLVTKFTKSGKTLYPVNSVESGVVEDPLHLYIPGGLFVKALEVHFHPVFEGPVAAYVVEGGLLLAPDVIAQIAGETMGKSFTGFNLGHMICP